MNCSCYFFIYFFPFGFVLFQLSERKKDCEKKLSPQLKMAVKIKLASHCRSCDIPMTMGVPMILTHTSFPLSPDYHHYCSRRDTECHQWICCQHGQVCNWNTEDAASDLAGCWGDNRWVCCFRSCQVFRLFVIFGGGGGDVCSLWWGNSCLILLLGGKGVGGGESFVVLVKIR